jgi:hypothetical protein
VRGAGAPEPSLCGSCVGHPTRGRHTFCVSALVNVPVTLSCVNK